MRQLIVIDPGHGGQNMGTQSGGLIEKEITLALGLELYRTLGGENLAAFRLTRESDMELTLGERGAMSFDADFVMSIHVNANPDQRAHGLTCYYWPNNKVGEDVCTAVLNAAPLRLQTKRPPIPTYDDPSTSTDDWIRSARNVLGAHRPTAVLVEVGFSTHNADRAYMLSTFGRSSIVCALRAGICRYLELSAGLG